MVSVARVVMWGVLGLVTLFGATAAAQRVTVLAFSGDEFHLREQVEEAVGGTSEVELVSLDAYRQRAEALALEEGQQMSEEGVAQVAPALALSAVVEGTVGSTFWVRILDSQGAELWSKELPLSEGRLSEDHAFKLAKAVVAAAKVAFRERPPERDPDLEVEAKPPPPAKKTAGGSWLTLEVGAGSTWRSYCSRPGVIHCRAYDALPEGSRPTGQTYDFSSAAPFAGVGVGVTALPLAYLSNPARGLGASAHYQRGFVPTRVTLGDTQSTVSASAELLELAALYRYPLSLPWVGDGREGYVGAFGGWTLHRFSVDGEAQVVLPASSRLFPSLGLELSIPVVRGFRVEGGASYFFNPKPGEEEVRAYGDATDPTGGASGQGFSLELGAGGALWGPVGYAVRYKLKSYLDRFYGGGEQWPCDGAQCGGSAQESYSSLAGSLTVAF